jgi:Holliday junction resolvase RusA-like endonuclease
MADVLVVTVPTFPEGGGQYPSVNSLGANGWRGGKKTSEYLALYRAVKAEAERQIKATGWVTADYICEVHWKRYTITKRAFDSQNCGKCENDALEEAGVFANDNLVKWCPDVPQYDPSPGAIDRIAMVVIRLYPPLNVLEKRAVGKNSRRVHPEVVEQREDKAPVSAPYILGNPQVAYLDGRPIPMCEALALVGIDPKRKRK